MTSPWSFMVSMMAICWLTIWKNSMAPGVNSVPLDAILGSICMYAAVRGAGAPRLGCHGSMPHVTGSCSIIIWAA